MARPQGAERVKNGQPEAGFEETTVCYHADVMTQHAWPRARDSRCAAHPSGCAVSPPCCESPFSCPGRVARPGDNGRLTRPPTPRRHLALYTRLVGAVGGRMNHTASTGPGGVSERELVMARLLTLRHYARPAPPCQSWVRTEEPRNQHSPALRRWLRRLSASRIIETCAVVATPSCAGCQPL